MEDAGTADVYDLTVEGVHNFVANGVVVHNCLHEIIQTCPPTRHRFGAGCAGVARVEQPDPDKPEDWSEQPCGLERACRVRVRDPITLEETVEPGPGRAAYADGWYNIDDAILKFRGLDRSIFDSEWLSLRPMGEGMAYPMFEDDIHVIDYDYNPNFPVVCGIDFGFTNASVALYAQPDDKGRIIVFAEDYKTKRVPDELAASIKSERWFDNTNWRVSDSAGAGDAQTLRNRGVPNEPCSKAGTPEEPSSVRAGITLCRYLLRPMGRQPFVYVDRRCVNFIREVKAYHMPPEKEDLNPKEAPAKKDDHCMDSWRYMMVRLFRGQLNV